MGAIINMLDYRKVELPNVDRIRVEIDDDGYLSLSFVDYSIPAIRCAQRKLPYWLRDRLKYLQEKITEFEENSVGVKISDTVFYVYTY